MERPGGRAFRSQALLFIGAAIVFLVLMNVLDALAALDAMSLNAGWRS
jgi:hypothetical protein